MKKFLLTICFLVLIISKVDAQACGTCSNADCSIVGPKTGATAAADLTTEMQKPATISANAFYVAGDPIDSKFGPYTFTNCYVVSVTSSSQTLGLKLSSVITGSNPTYTGVLYKGSNSCSNPINPTRTNVAGGSSGFNPEWDGLAIGVYTYCLTVNIPAASSMKSILMGYYLSGATLTPSNTCSDCAAASCDIAGPYPDFTEASSASNHCSKTVLLNSSPVQSPNKYISYYKVKTSNSATTLGIIISNQTGTTDGSGNSCPKPTRVATLYPVGSNCSTGTVGSSTSNITNYFNVEWSALSTNTEYIIKVETTATSGCQVEDQCASYYSPGSVAQLPCGTVGMNWRNAANTPSASDLNNCVDKNFEVKANSVVIAQQDIAPGFLIDNDFGKINLTKIELDQGQTGTYINTNLVKDITFCSPNVGYNVRLTGSVISPGSGIIRIIDHATGQDLYVGAFTNGMVIPINAGTLKGTAVFSGPGVSNYRLNYPTSGATSYTGAGYGFFNPKKAGNGNHTITYAWNNGNQDCGTATIQVTVSGCATPVCKVVDIDLYDDNQISTPHTGTSFDCNSNVVYLAPKDVVNKYLTTTEDPDFTWPFPMIRTEITATSGNMNNLLINYYDPISGVLIESGNAIAVNTHYFARKEGYQITLDKTDNTSGTYTYITYDVMTGAVITSGTITVTNGAESAKTVVMKPTNFNGIFTCTTCGSGALIQGISPYIDELGLGTFDPKKAGAGTHILTYTWDNGLTGTNHCSGTKSITVTVTGGPTITPALSDVCVGATTTKLTYTSTGTPNKYSIDWNAAANTAGLNDVTDVALGASPVNVTIPGTLAAGTYTGALTAKNASGCSSAAQTVTLKVNASPSITGTTSLCEGTTAIDWKPTSGVTWSSSDATIASVSTGGTLSGYKAGTVTITATDNTTQCTSTKQVTVNPKPTIIGTLTVCEGSTTSLTGSGTAATTTPWVSATTSNATVSNTGVVTGVTGGNGTSEITYTDNKGCSAKTTVSVNPILFPTVTCGTSTATSVTFTWGAVTGATTYDIVYNKDNGGDQTVTGHTSTSYPVSNVPAGKSVTIIVTPKGTGCFKASTIKTCTADNCPTPTITQEPTNSTKCDGTSTSFSVTASSTATLSYQWQINNGAGTPTNLTNTGVYSGANTSILSISDVKGLNGTKYQCLVTETSSGTGCNKTSVVATLTVNPIPSFLPTVSDICEGNDPALAYTNLTGNPNQIVFDPNLPLVSPINIPVSNSPIVISGLPIKLPVNTYSGLKVRLENTVTGCKSNDITIASFKVQATQTPSISSKGTDVSSVTFQWSDLTGLNTQTGAKEDNYLVEEFICNSCSTVGTYGTATGTLSYNTSTSKWEYLKNNLQPGDKVFIKVTPKDNSPLATPSCYGSSVFDLTAIPCDAPIITKDLADVTICEGTTTNPVSTSFDLGYNSADLNTPLTWEFLTPGGTWKPLTISGVYSVNGSTNSSTTLSISNVNGLDGIKFRVVLKTATVGGSCNTVSKEVLLTVKPLPTMVSVADKSFCPGTLVNDPLKPKDFDFKVSQVGSPTFTWKSDLQTTGVKLEGINSTDGTKNVSEFESFTTSNPTVDAVSIITVIPTLDQCVGQPITFKIKVKPTVKPVNFAAVNDFNNVKFTWATSSVLPDYWNIDTAITNINAAQPTLAQYKNVTSPLVTGATTEFTVGGINSSKKAYIIVTPKQDASKTELFCPASDGFSGIPTPCTKPTKPADPIVTAVCEGAPITVNGVNNDLTANFQWKISTDAGVTWNNVSFTDFANTGTTNILSSQVTKSYMNNALVKVVLTDKQTGQCSEESNPVKLLINVLPNVKLIQPVKTSLCIDDNDVSAFIQPIQGKSPLKVDYTLNNVISTNQDIANLEIKFSAKSEMNYSLSVTKVIDANNCESSLTGLTSLVSVHKNPTPSFAVSDTIGCYPLKINFTDISGEKFTDVTWDFGTGTNSSKDLGTTSFTYQKQGDYTITYSVINEYGCSGEIVKVDEIHVKNSPIAVISTDRNIVNVYENVVQFNSKLSQNGTFYKWDFGDNSSFSNEPIVKHKYDPNVTGKFKVYLIVSNSTTNATCSDTAVTWIDFPEEVVYFIPNTFTPNGDEFNNTFQPIFTSGFDPQNYSFTIFDRWGQIVFESKNPNVGWDGTYGDKLLGNDTFVWKLGFKEKANDNEHYTTGHVNLVK